MKFTLDKKVIVGIAVVVVLVLIIIAWRSRSTYAANTMPAATAGTSQGDLYAKLSECQATFVTSSISDLTVHSEVTCSATGVSVTTTVPHSYAVGNPITVSGISSDGTKSTIGFNGSTTIASVPDNMHYTYSISGVPCTQNVTMSTKGYSWLQSASSVTANEATRAACVSSNVTQYVNTMCKWSSVNDATGAQNIPANDSGDGTVITSKDGVSSNTMYKAYQTDLTNINTAYQKVILTIGVTQPALLATAEAARKADFTSATRKYFQTICPGFYAQTDTSDPGSAVVERYPQSPYSSYTSTSTATTGVSGSAFNASLITIPNINNWATYYSGPKKDFTTGANVYAIGTKNSDIVIDIGPGTVTSMGPIPGTTGATTTMVLNTA